MEVPLGSTPLALFVRGELGFLSASLQAGGTGGVQLGLPPVKSRAFPACTMDIFPTLIGLAGLDPDSIGKTVDGISLDVLLHETPPARRSQPIGFRHTQRGAMVDNNLKLVAPRIGSGIYEIYDLAADPGEKHNLFNLGSSASKALIKQFEAWNRSVKQSLEGADYPEGRVIPHSRKQQTSWTKLPEYQKYFTEWKDRPEFKPYIDRYQQQK